MKQFSPGPISPQICYSASTVSLHPDTVNEDGVTRQRPWPKQRASGQSCVSSLGSFCCSYILANDPILSSFTWPHTLNHLIYQTMTLLQGSAKTKADSLDKESVDFLLRNSGQSLGGSLDLLSQHAKVAFRLQSNKTSGGANSLGFLHPLHLTMSYCCDRLKLFPLSSPVSFGKDIFGTSSSTRFFEW